MRIIGFNVGQLGDLVINTVAARGIKEIYPESHLTMGVASKYAGIIPLFYQHPYFDNFHCYGAYDGWPSKEDKEYLLRSKYDIIFQGMPQHSSDQWWSMYNQTEEVCKMHGIPVPVNNNCILNPWFHSTSKNMKDTVVFNYIGGFYAGYPNSKSYNPDRAQAIVDLVRSMGYKVLLLGDPKEPGLEGAEKKNLTLLESVEAMLNSKMLIGVDSFLTWAASAYQFPVLACYSHRYYGGEFVKNIQAPNPEAEYLNAPDLNEIPFDVIRSKLEDML